VKKKLIIDTDCGIDDAVAILMALADPDSEVIGITCVNGNVALNKVLRNVPIVLDAAGAGPIPIFAGASRPLLSVPVDAAEVHGHDGLGDAGFPQSTRVISDEPAVTALVRLARENPGATLIALGPLTNIALALALEPALPQLLGTTFIMGGAVQAVGNVTPVAEFNIYADAEAAAMTFARGLNPTVATWEATLAAPIPWEVWERIVHAGSVGTRFVMPMLAASIARSQQRMRPGILLPDPLAMAALLDPGCVESFRSTITVDTSHGIAHGMTALDTHGMLGMPHNAQIVSGADIGRFAELLARAFRMDCALE
jgi:purine nucleosidase